MLQWKFNFFSEFDVWMLISQFLYQAICLKKGGANSSLHPPIKRKGSAPDPLQPPGYGPELNNPNLQLTKVYLI